MTTSQIATALKNTGFVTEMVGSVVVVSLKNRAICISEVETALGFKVAYSRFGRDKYGNVTVR